MTTSVPNAEPQLLFRKERVGPFDQSVFVFKVALALGLVAAGVSLALSDRWYVALPGCLLLAAVYTHMVELQHQCLHHSAFRRSKLHRRVGVPLGVPLLVAYSHYRVRHLQHHRYLGTPNDSEFFGFDPRKPLTWGVLLRGLLDYLRLATVVRDIGRAYTGRWTYDAGQIAERRRREIAAEYRMFGVVLAAVAALAVAGFGEEILRLWLVPLVFAVPMHFLVELPEHLLCETETTDVLRNTRSIQGSWFSTWFTNGNNLHVEHHAAMVVPINRLRERHPDVQRHAVHVERSYLDFFATVASTAHRNAKKSLS
ncbi:fatty acid desaturase [Streptomyces sp. Amel2xB2]|uniref:fatty acid desaturase family protein n=1 Tax=Streptomyces sp. Amel2xB2 TaxID=1305829 RepID=UPI000DB8FCAF|nr:fatty acid desaturase [Streptomyces sp. Amel2xB2]RAJ58361.1 fatty acid desaturase [Streptomyces sp. Amel2xB2]